MAIPSSGSYAYQSIRAELIIREAYERIGILGDFLTAGQLEAAMRSINFLLSDWSNRNVNLWELDTFYLTLQPGVNSYRLPSEQQNIIQAQLRTSFRQLHGTAFVSQTAGNVDDGVAAEAFDNNSKTACTQTQANGFIGYDYGLRNNVVNNQKQVINFVGITSNIDRLYTINIEGSNDNVAWDTLRSLGKLSFVKGINQWFDLSNIQPYRYYRIKETGGVVLEIQEIYFNNFVTDTIMTEISMYEYNNYPKKGIVGRPTVYYVHYNIDPVITIWQTPSVVYNCMVYSSQQMIQTVTSYTESINITSSFYEPLIYGLAEILAIKYAPDKAQLMQSKYEQTMGLATLKNTVELPLTFGVYGL